MRSRQHLPNRWLFTDERLGDVIGIMGRLPRGTGVIFRHHGLAAAERRQLLRRLKRVATARGLTLIDEADGAVARVHNSRELRLALSRRTPLVFVSSLYPTRSHPERAPLSLMRAAALARLAGGRALALGGMDARRSRAVRRLGFAGWGGIDAWQASEPPRPSRG